MKKVTIILTGVILMSIASLSVKAQNTASVPEAQASATVIKPINIENPVILNFGNLISSSTAGTIVLDVNGQRNASAGVTLPTAIPGNVSAAQFNVSGENNAHYALSISESVNLENSSSNIMVLNNFQHNATRILSGTGVETFNVGGTLNVLAGQASGLYEGTYTVTVTYE
ncbi:MAG: DUF4402 domain-containing protein [Lentimicrobiaceae bacterium]|nr:DUF4402 domain-containing protein [Lentimicrobiaceae bacterium]MCO5267140.1 DUF4402 domain-containing protein [Lentimicrobium sp.]